MKNTEVLDLLKELNYLTEKYNIEKIIFNEKEIMIEINGFIKIILSNNNLKDTIKKYKSICNDK